MKTLSFVICFFLFLDGLQSQKSQTSGNKISHSGNIIDKDVARVIAQHFMYEQNESQSTQKSLPNLSLSDTKTLQVNAKPALYVFSNHGEGFIIVSADSSVTPVIGYSAEGVFPEKGVCPNFDSYLETYLDQIAWVREHPFPNSPEIQSRWKKLLAGEANFSNNAERGVAPLLTSLWSQGYPYNAFCPKESSLQGGHVPAGCVATAISMIMYYYRYPLQGNGYYSYTFTSSHGIQKLSVNFAASKYDWDGMLDQISTTSGQCIPDVAQLLYNAGVSLSTVYGPNGSAVFNYDISQPLIEHFGYSSLTKNLRRNPNSTTNEEWENIVIEQLDSLNPVYYSGSNPSNGTGHAFVCDGYQVNGTENFFHFNFGWGGSGNGYYTLNNPSGFSRSQNVLTNFYPEKGYPYGCSTHIIKDANGSFEDGSSPKCNYKPNLNCTWLIAPSDSVNSITLSFNTFNVDNSDSVFIYDGENENAKLMCVYTGTTIPPAVTSGSNKLFLKFNTDGTNEAKGWMAEFHSTSPDFCNEMTLLTDSDGSFTDGSGNNNYNNNGSCKWKIEPPNSNNLTLSFKHFDLEENDSLVVYSVSSGDSISRIGAYTGKHIPAPVFSPTGSLLLVFNTNDFTAAAGFDAEYSSSVVVSNESLLFPDMKLSPNPAREYTVLHIANIYPVKALLTISDMTGKQLYSEILDDSDGKIDKQIILGKFNKGMYILRLKTSNGIRTDKLIVE